MKTAWFRQSMWRIAGSVVAGLACVTITAALLSCGDSDSPTESDEPFTVTDVDGNVYQAVRIGKRVWMTENLRVKHFRNGDPIPEVTDTYNWVNMHPPAFCYYNNNSATAPEYGLLYNWYAVNDSRGLAPKGWHIASESDWVLLELELGMSESTIDSTGWRGTNEGQNLKESGTAHWVEPNGGTNELGLAALPGGYRDPTSGFFYGLGTWTVWWTSTLLDSLYVPRRELRSSDGKIGRLWTLERYLYPMGSSVRCVRDI